MIISIEWLRSLVDFDLNSQDLADLLTAGGIEAECGGETILKLDLTPNRPDCMSHLGVAREVALLTDSELKRHRIDLSESKVKVDDSFSIEIVDEKACPRYAARIVRNLKIGPSPDWMSSRLEVVGIRSINNVVDVANYVLMELGHPLHTFDLNLLEGGKIIVRLAKEGEKIVTLDDEKRTLNNYHLLTCDAKKPVALAGIMGCANSEVTESTTDILIESAYFDPITIRRGSKSLGLTTEASKRFERGTDFEGLITALDRTADLLSECAGGDIDGGILDAYPNKISNEKITLRADKASELIGFEIDDTFIEKTFAGLEISSKKTKDGFTALPPTFRPDLKREIDLIEELARVYGYGSIPSDYLFDGNITQIKEDPLKHVMNLKRFLAGIGFNEISSNSLMNRKRAALFLEGDFLEVQNPLSIEMSALRPSLLPGLLRSIKYNLNRSEPNLALFEHGIVFTANSKANLGREEAEHLTGVVCGQRSPQGWRSGDQPYDLYYLKGLMSSLADFINVTPTDISEAEQSSYFDSEQIVTGNGSVIAQIGAIRNDQLQAYDIEVLLFGFSINLDFITSAMAETSKYQSVPQFPAIVRDFTFSVANDVQVGEIEKLIRNEGTDLLTKVELVDLYAGKQVSLDNKSVSFRMKFESKDRTLTDAEIDKISESIIQVTGNKLGAKLR